MLKYELELTLPRDGFDECGNLMPGEVLRIFELLAGQHAEILGVGFEAMLQRNLLWVVTAIRYQVCGELQSGQKVRGITWPLPQTKVGFVREYLICDENGEVLIKGTSNWATIHADTRQLAVASEVYPQGEYCLDRNFSDRTRRIRDFEADGGEIIIRPDASAIDVNGHVNNTRYADFACRALGSFVGRIDTFQIDYLREVLCGEELRLQTAKTETLCLVKGLAHGEERMFTCSAVLK